MAARDLALGLDLLGRDCGGSVGRRSEREVPTSTPQPKPAQQACASGTALRLVDGN
jgi:hypothetical protein